METSLCSFATYINDEGLSFWASATIFSSVTNASHYDLHRLADSLIVSIVLASKVIDGSLLFFIVHHPLLRLSSLATICASSPFDLQRPHKIVAKRSDDVFIYHGVCVQAIDKDILWEFHPKKLMFGVYNQV